MAYTRRNVTDGVTIMNKDLYDNVQDGIDEAKQELSKMGGTIEVGDEPTKENTVLTVDPNGDEVVIYTAEEVDEMFENVSNRIVNCLPKNQGASNVGKILVVGTDGNLVLIDMPEGGTSGDVTGVLDESNNILLSGNLADGTYPLKWLLTDGTYADAGTLEVSGILKVTSICATKTKTSYFEGDTLNTDDITVTATYSDGSAVIVTDYTVDSSTVQMDTAGSYNLVISYGGVSTTIGITVSVYQIINLAKPNPTNTTDTSIWCNDARLGSDGTYRSHSGTVITNFIPCTGGVVYVKGMNISLDSNSMNNSISFWDDSKNLLSISAIIDYTNIDCMDASQSDNGVYTFDLANIHTLDKLKNKEIAYVRLVGSLTGTLDDVVITVNQPIPVTVDIALTNGIRIGSDGTDRTQVGYCATPRIDLTDIPKPCIINLTKARWAFTNTATTGMVMYYATKSDGSKLVGGYTNESVGGGYFTVKINDTLGTDVTVTVTSDEVATIRFSGHWANNDYSDSDTYFEQANTKATLTHTPTA